MTEQTAVGLAREFWRLMASNDFHSVAAVLAPQFVLEWPQSGERIRGARNFGCMNQAYEAHGPWRFNIVRLVGDDREAVTEVDVTDGKTQARAISFFTIERGKISRLVEYWPEPYAPRADRAHLTEPID
jgi:ketosteroid isomerase-like protein